MPQVTGALQLDCRASQLPGLGGVHAADRPGSRRSGMAGGGLGRASANATEEPDPTIVNTAFLG
jgi:hypothetical protein